MMSTIRKHEDDIFKEWQELDCYSKSFVCDGVVDPVEWQQQDTHILFLLKEAHGTEWKGDLRSFLYGGGIPTTWNNVVRWTCGILTNCDFSIASKATDNRPMWLRKVAVVNVKKSGGGASTNTKAMKETYNESQGQRLLAEQLSLYDNLDYIICCGKGVKDCLCEALSQEALKNKWPFSYKGQWLDEQKTEILLPPSGFKAPVIINYYHPQCHIGKKKLFNTLIEVIDIIKKQMF